MAAARSRRGASFSPISSRRSRSRELSRGGAGYPSPSKTAAKARYRRLFAADAASGAVALETLLPAALRLVHAGAMDLPCLWRALSFNPARRLGLPGGRLAEGAPADLVLFDPDAPFVLDRFALKSKSKNTPFDGARMQGKVLGTWVSGRRVYGADNA